MPAKLCFFGTSSSWLNHRRSIVTNKYTGWKHSHLVKAVDNDLPPAICFELCGLFFLIHIRLKHITSAVYINLNSDFNTLQHYRILLCFEASTAMHHRQWWCMAWLQSSSYFSIPAYRTKYISMPLSLEIFPILLLLWQYVVVTYRMPVTMQILSYDSLFQW